MVTCPTHPEKFIQDNDVATFVLLWVVIVTLPARMDHKQFIHGGHRALKVLEIFLLYFARTSEVLENGIVHRKFRNLI